MLVPPSHGGPTPQYAMPAIPAAPLRIKTTAEWTLPDDRIEFYPEEIELIEQQAATLSSEEEIQQLFEIWRCRKSIRYWIDTYVYIKTVNGFEKWLPYKWQYRMLYALADGQSLMVLKSRQVGASWVAAAYATWRCLFFPDQACYFFSVSEDKAESQMGRVKDYLSRLPEWMKAGVEELSLRIRFTGSRSTIDSKPAGKNTGRGETATFILCDEMGFWDYDEYMWAGIYPTLSTGGQGMVVSTPPEPERGERVYIHLLERINQGIARNDPDYSNWESIKVHYSECRGRDENWVRKQKVGLRESVWRREYELVMGEVGFPFFANDKIQYRPERKPVPGWEQGPFFQGVDTSEMKKGHDLSAIQVLDSEGVQVHAWSSSPSAPPSLGEWVGDPKAGDDGIVGNHILRYPGIAYIERNAQGLLTLTAAERYNDGDHIVLGWFTGQTSRANALNELALDLESGRVIITDEYTYQCLQNFVQTDKGKPVAAFGWKDDPVLALALANQARRKGETMVLSGAAPGGDRRLDLSYGGMQPQTQYGIAARETAPAWGGEERWTFSL